MRCFENVTEFFPNGLNSSIEGKDILDTDIKKNSLFYYYNHVVIPYCSSDVWLGEETEITAAIMMDVSECDCFDYKTVSNQNGCFNFNPRSSDIPFTFRGKIIFQSVIKQLIDKYGLSNAESIILGGSSAGGLGVVNHAKWTRGVLKSETELRVLLDSSWFVDFQDGIKAVFSVLATSKPESISDNTQRVLNVIKSNQACNDTNRFEYPCCISAHCIMTEQTSDGELAYYPEDTPTFAIISVYDIYLLSSSLQRITDLESIQAASNSGNGIGGIDIMLNFLRVVGEYGGTMNHTVDLVDRKVG